MTGYISKPTYRNIPLPLYKNEMSAKEDITFFYKTLRISTLPTIIENTSIVP